MIIVCVLVHHNEKCSVVNTAETHDHLWKVLSMKLSIPVCSGLIFCPVAQQTTPLTAIHSETTTLYIPTHCFSKTSIYFHKALYAHLIDFIFDAISLIVSYWQL